jgi:hypothetical protein
MRMTIVFALVCYAGCGEDDQVTEVVDEGRACLVSSLGSERAQQFVAGQPVYVLYSLDDVCLSSSCAIDRYAECSIAIDGRVLDVTSIFRWVDLSHSSNVCTDDCTGVSAICQTDPLAEGTYEFKFRGAATVSLTIPSQLPTPTCLEISSEPML